MITRFYYNLTTEWTTQVQGLNWNEFGMTLQKERETPLGPVLYVYDRYAPINQEQGIFWLINELTGETAGVDTDITKELLKHIWLNLYDKDVGYVDVEHPRWETPSKPHSGDDWLAMKRELGNNIWSLYLDTKDYYEKLIAMYEDELEDLEEFLGPLTTTSTNNAETRFNDTPQNTLANGTYADDNFATNVTKSNGGSTVTAEVATKMARLNEVQGMLRNLYADWAFEFNKLIVGE